MIVKRLEDETERRTQQFDYSVLNSIISEISIGKIKVVLSHQGKRLCMALSININVPITPDMSI